MLSCRKSIWSWASLLNLSITTPLELNARRFNMTALFNVGCLAFNIPPIPPLAIISVTIYFPTLVFIFFLSSAIIDYYPHSGVFNLHDILIQVNIRQRIDFSNNKFIGIVYLDVFSVGPFVIERGGRPVAAEIKDVLLKRPQKFSQHKSDAPLFRGVVVGPGAALN